MLPSRGIVRVLPPSGAQKHILRQATSSTVAHGNGRQFGTLRRGAATGLSTALASQRRPRQYAAPIALGTVAASRSISIPGLSLWGYGKKTTPEAAAATADSSTTQAVVGQTPEPQVAAVAPPPETTTPVVDPAAAADPTSQAALSEISDLVNNGAAAEILNREEGIGYLSSLGLDFGYGPTSIMQWALEHIHVWTGLGWAGSVIAMAFAVRVVMFYPQIKGTIFSHQMRQMQEDPRYKSAMADYQKALRSGDQATLQQAGFLNKMLRQEYDVPFSKMLWNFLPLPFSFGLFRLVTGMTHIPVPSLETAGWAWFTDLTSSDPYYILPAVATGFMILAIRLNMKNQTAEQAAMMKKIGWFAVPVMIFATSFLSAAINLMGAAFGCATFISTYLLNNNSVRRLLSIPQIKPPAQAHAVLPPKPTQYTTKAYTPEGMKERFDTGLSDVKKGWADGMSKMTGTASVSAEEKAERKRREDLQKSEEKRQQKERAHFEQKYKGRR